MKTLRFWKKLTALTMSKFCQQRMLLAGLALLCFLLPFFLGPVAEAALSQGVSFDGLTLAIVTEAEDPAGQQLEQLLSGMRDLRRYCQVTAMTRQEADAGLAQGEIIAALVLPEDFISGILTGTNPDVLLIVPADRPLEALLTLWLGESATNLLAAFQSGIYTVLDQYQQNPPTDLSYENVMTRINLRYINWTLNRQGIFRVETIPITDHLPIGLHYSLSLLAYLLLAMAPVFWGIYGPEWVCSLKRFRAAGIGPGICYCAGFTVCWLVETVIIFLLRIILVREALLLALPVSMLCGLFCAGFGSVCCLLAPDTGSCGILSFGGALVFLALSGGILPPVLMPSVLKPCVPLSPVTWLRNVLAGEPAPQPGSLWALLLSAAVLILAGGLLYAHRAGKERTAL